MFPVEFSGGMLLPIVTVASAQLSPVSSVSPDKEGMGGVECDQLIGAIVIVGNCCSFVVVWVHDRDSLDRANCGRLLMG